MCMDKPCVGKIIKKDTEVVSFLTILFLQAFA